IPRKTATRYGSFVAKLRDVYDKEAEVKRTRVNAESPLHRESRAKPTKEDAQLPFKAPLFITNYGRVVASLPQRVGTVSPYFFPLKDFEGCPAMPGLIQRINSKKAIGLPSVEEVIAALGKCKKHIIAIRRQANGGQPIDGDLEVYVNLLKLLWEVADLH